jgi:hypothetical protein
VAGTEWFESLTTGLAEVFEFPFGFGMEDQAFHLSLERISRRTLDAGFPWTFTDASDVYRLRDSLAQNRSFFKITKGSGLTNNN